MNYQIGLDIGASGVKLAVFEGTGAKSHLVRFELFDSSDEGILTEDELYRGIKEFLDSKSYGRSTVCLGLPQYQVTTSVADYPHAKNRELSQMVAMDALQVGGLSDASFVHDYAALPRGNGRQGPVLIAMSREDGVCERLQRMSDVGLCCESLVPAGFALVNAAFELCQGLRECAEPVLILDIGRENTMIAGVVGGQLLYVGTLMFSASKLEDAAKAILAQRKRVDGVQTIQDVLDDVDLSTESGQSPFRQAMQSLESEIQDAVEHWRSQENELVANMPVTRMYVTGGGSRLGGIASWLKDILECDVACFGPEVDGTVRPDLTVAYGLGLQAANNCSLAVSLIPSAVRNARLRQRRWPLLAIAAGVFFATVFSVLISHRVTNVMDIEELSAKKGRLSQCLEVANRIKASRNAAKSLEQKMAMLAVTANRGGRIVEAVRWLSRAPLQYSWLIYLANDSGANGSGDFFAGGRASESQGMVIKSAAPSQKRVSLQDMRVEREFVCAGYAPENHRDEVAALMSYLEASSAQERFFAGVDRGDSIADSASQLIWLWREYLNGNDKRLALGLQKQGRRQGSFADSFELFTLRLPFAHGDVRADEADAESEEE